MCVSLACANSIEHVKNEWLNCVVVVLFNAATVGQRCVSNPSLSQRESIKRVKLTHFLTGWNPFQKLSCKYCIFSLCVVRIDHVLLFVNCKRRNGRCNGASWAKCLTVVSSERCLCKCKPFLSGATCSVLIDLFAWALVPLHELFSVSPDDDHL